jgi:hypothetical protein
MIGNITEREDKLCSKSKHVKQSLNDAVDYLESIGWYDFNSNRKVKK